MLCIERRIAKHIKGQFCDHHDNVQVTVQKLKGVKLVKRGRVQEDFDSYMVSGVLVVNKLELHFKTHIKAGGRI